MFKTFIRYSWFFILLNWSFLFSFFLVRKWLNNSYFVLLSRNTYVFLTLFSYTIEIFAACGMMLTTYKFTQVFFFWVFFLDLVFFLFLIITTKLPYLFWYRFHEIMMFSYLKLGVSHINHDWSNILFSKYF